MTEQNDLKGGSRMLFIAAAFVVVIYGIYQAQSVLVYLLVSVFFAVLGTPPLLWLERKGVPAIIAVSLVVGGITGVLLVIGVLAGASIRSFLYALPFYEARLQDQFLAIREIFLSRGIEISDKFLLEYLDPGKVMDMTARLLSGVSAALSNIVLILLTVTFILLEASSFPVKIRAVLGAPEAVFPEYSRFVETMKRYMVIQTGVSLVTGILVWGWLAILGVDFAVLWGLLGFLLNYIPNLGSIIAAIPAVLLAFVQLGLGRALLAAAGYILVNFIIGNFIQPRLLGRGLGLSTLVVFLSLIFWGSLLGYIGMVLSIPITMAFKIAFESNESTRWIAVLLGPELTPADVVKPPMTTDL